MKRVGRSIYRMIFWLPLAAMFFLMVAAMNAAGPSHSGAGQTFLLWCCALFVLWLVVGRRIAFRLVPFFVSKLTCPGCGEEIDAIGIWNCGCGYKDHRERHILAKVCPQCGKVAGHVDCPRCDSTILLR